MLKSYKILDDGMVEETKEVAETLVKVYRKEELEKEKEKLTARLAEVNELLTKFIK